MKILAFACAFALALFCPHSSWAARTAFQAQCEDSMAKAVSVLYSTPSGYTINNTVSFHGLSAMKPGPANTFVLGLTKTESRSTISLKAPMLIDPVSGYECVAPRITVALLYSPVVVYVGSEFRPGSCAYQEILAHEMRHLKTYLDHLPKVEVTVRAALARRFNDKPLYARRGQAMALLQQELNTGWAPYIKNEMAKVDPLQAAIDTPQEYARLSKVCAGEVQSIVRPANRNR
ncbi:hypothetical protein [Massilia antarctica]|uniref:hypothetical protein n=1 Tax=Massilia antarctica TaxID=2765360 RepID=UPI0006BB6AAE|nr:hypothetical protein [Massilia sp. H27-R4]MCY0913886.1 hypothetical protein [Massilia sp. H27-R4]CUI04384.1 PUTATIVE SIGNAL PEPTIDE PROTEIN [Janthinobacterium sp. CG23_2]CUU28170.1 PUTATIVE SIGNAL PEPTIDE PROTEIN [Janthinobacterium sp. CG23_2]